MWDMKQKATNEQASKLIDATEWWLAEGKWGGRRTKGVKHMVTGD